MRRFQEGRRRSREPREEGQSRRRSTGTGRRKPQRDVPSDQPACLVCDDGLVMGMCTELGG
jgi:hypothetical protein